jgi:DNA-binding MarR family transcriptional regulator
LTEGGRAVFLSVLSALRAREEDVLAGFDPDHIEEVKAFLR